MCLLHLELVDGYEEAGEALKAVDCYYNGLPAGYSWRAAAKLSNAELLAGLKIAYDENEGVDSY